MDFFTHLIIAVLISLITLNSMPFSLIVYACIMAIFADLDIVLEPLRKIFKSNLLAHKGISHSIFYSAFISALMGIIFSMITNTFFLISWLVGFLFYDLHIFLDFLTASKVPLFYPISKKRFRFFIDRAINFYLALVSGNFILFSIIAFYFLQDFFFIGYFYALIGFYAIYFGFRALFKIIIKIKSPNNYKIIPGITPFSYLLFIRTETEYNIKFELIFKSFFKKSPNLILTSTLNMNSIYDQLYTRALDLLQQFPFGEKWDSIIPIFEETPKIVKIVLVFGESFFRGHYYSIKFTFNKENFELLELNERFI